MASFCGECGTPDSNHRFCTGCGAPAAGPRTSADVSAGPAEQAPLTPLAASSWQVWSSRLERLFSFRTIFANALVAGVLAYLASLLWEPLGAVVFIGAFLILHVAVTFDAGLILKCPYCSKRVKARAQSCHHCGRMVSPA